MTSKNKSEIDLVDEVNQLILIGAGVRHALFTDGAYVETEI